MIQKEPLQLFSQTFDHAGVGMAHVSPAGEFLRVNGAFCRLTGYDQETLLGRLDRDVIHPEDLLKVRNPEHFFEGQDPHGEPQEVRFFHYQGAMRQGNLTVSVIYDRDRHPHCYLYVLTDITPTQKEQGFYGKVLAQISDAVFMVDATGQFSFVCPNVSQIFGHSPQDIQALGHVDRVFGADFFTTYLQPLAQSHHNLDYAIYNAHHQRRDLLINIQRVDFGHGQYLITCRDISDRKEAEIALQRLQDIYQEAERLANLGSWELNHQEGKSYWSSQAFTLLEIDPHTTEPSYGLFLQRVHPEDRSQIQNLYQGHLSDRIPFELTHRLQMDDGRIKYVRACCRTVFDGHNQPILSRGMIQDITPLHTMQTRLAQSTQARYQRLVNDIGARFAVFSYDVDKVLQYLSDGFENIFGTPKEAVLGKTWVQAVAWSKDSLALGIKKLRILLTEKPPTQRFTVSFTHPQGQLKTIVVTQHAIWTEIGELAAVEGIIEDITEEVQSATHISRLMKRVKIASEASQMGIWEWDIKRNLVTWDEQMYKLYGLGQGHPSELFDRWLHTLHPDDVGQVQAKIMMAVDSGKNFNYQFRVIRPSDSVMRWMEVYGVVESDRHGQSLRLIGTNTDVTDRITAETALQKSQEKFQRLVEDIDLEGKLTIFRYTGDRHQLTDISMGIQSLANLSPKALIGKSWAEILPWTAEDLDLAARQIQILKTEKPRYQQFQMRFQGEEDPQLHTVQILQHPVWDEEGNLVAIEGILQDITAQKNHELCLEQTNRELMKATRLKDEFLANMSHELRTPLNAILGMTEALQDEIFGKINPRQKKSLDTVERSGTHLLELINEILDLSKIESGQIELECGPVSAVSLCQSSLIFIKQQALKKRIKVNAQIPSHLPKLWVDERRIRQVLINLLNNAVKFTHEGGEIDLQVHLLALSEIPPGAEEESPQFLRIMVKDTGIGIAPQDMEKLFQPFVQIDSALNRKYTGTGLGLATVKRVVELHGGQVGLVSQVGVGSCFNVDLPCVRSPAAGTLSAPSFPVDLTSGVVDSPNPETLASVLLVEGNQRNVVTLTSYLRAKGYGVVVVPDGETAIAQAPTLNPEVILMDLETSGMAAPETAQQIRQLPQLEKVVIIGLADQDQDEPLPDLPMFDELFSRPIRLKQLVDSIAHFLHPESP